MISRRGILGAIIAAPAIVRASSIMPIKAWLADNWDAVSYRRAQVLLAASMRQTQLIMSENLMNTAFSVQWSDDGDHWKELFAEPGPYKYEPVSDAAHWLSQRTA